MQMKKIRAGNQENIQKDNQNLFQPIRTAYNKRIASKIELQTRATVEIFLLMLSGVVTSRKIRHSPHCVLPVFVDDVMFS